MTRNRPLPEELPDVFTLAQAAALGVGRGRLRGQDLVIPFPGVRATAGMDDVPDAEAFPGEVRRARILKRARAYAPKLRESQLFSHTTAATIWGAPVPVGDETLHISVLGNGSLPRTTGVRGHRVLPTMATVRQREGLRVSSPASTWAMLGDLAVFDLVAIGDYLCRVWREGFLRRNVGRPPLTTPAELAAALKAGRRHGAVRLRAALELVRLDSWSPRESLTRCIIVAAGLPEPELNVDLWGERGEFLGCVDLCYPEYRVAIEYQGHVHSAQYARDVERIEGLRARGWIVIQVTSALIDRPEELAARVRRALRSRGWRG